MSDLSELSFQFEEYKREMELEMQELRDEIKELKENYSLLEEIRLFLADTFKNFN